MGEGEEGGRRKENERSGITRYGGDGNEIGVRVNEGSNWRVKRMTNFYFSNSFSGSGWRQPSSQLPA